MRLSTLIGRDVPRDPEIAGLASDSRDARPGYLFAALAGAQTDGARFIDDAVRRGAVAVLAEPGAPAPAAAALVESDNPRRDLARLAAAFYARQPETVVAITGTNGKTSTAWIAAELWRRLGDRSGVVGTLGAHADDFHRELRHTTPDPITLHETLDAMVGAGIRRVALEASSHALAQHRIDGVRLAGGAFTNITRDHLDYHKDFGDYFRAKRRLFDDAIPSGGFAVVNMPLSADAEPAREICAAARGRGVRVVTTGPGGGDLTLIDCAPTPDGLRVTARANGRAHVVTLGLIGGFQAENALVAAALVAEAGGVIEEILPLLAGVAAPPGRMERCATAPSGGVAYVDYAHTPDAVAAALRAIRPHARGRVVAVLGAGGDRDREKRGAMGAAAARYADFAIVTDDNPRHEDPAAIRKQVLAKAPDAIEIGDRAEAIERGVSMLGDGDVLLILGKGHESGQIVGAATYPFSDAAVAREAVARLGEEEKL